MTAKIVRKAESQTCEALVGRREQETRRSLVYCCAPAVVILDPTEGGDSIALCVRHALRLVGEITSIIVASTEEGSGREDQEGESG